MGCGKSYPLGEGGENQSNNDQALSIDIKDPNQHTVNNLGCTGPKAKMGKDSDSITILHFNDVYNIEPRDQDPVGGAARFVTALRSHHEENPLVLFSGDAFNPSLMSSITKGKQMVPVLNAMNIQCACYGNHDFDFGVDVLSKMAAQCNFPWLLANVYDNLSEKILADGIPTKMIEWQGKKIGLIGLVEEEWIATLATLDADDITFIDYVKEGRRLGQQLRDQGADYVIALTHMRWPNDRRLAREVMEIDLVLGGHDHDYNIEQVEGKWVIKSGTDFREYSKIKLKFQRNKCVDVNIERFEVDASVQEDKEVKEVVDKYIAIMGEKMENVIGYMDVELDGKFSSVRTKETNLGNFVTDIMLEAVDADLALLNSGTLRSDTIHPKGPFKMKDLCSILPMVDPLVVLKLTGHQVLHALENSVSQYPSLEGRFPQVAGVKFAFDPNKPSGSRIDPRYVRIQGKYMDLDKFYRLVTKHYLAEGKDGYDAFKEGEILVNDEEGPRLSIIVQNHFKAVEIVKGRKVAKTPHRQSLISLNSYNSNPDKGYREMNTRKSLVKQMTLPDDNNVHPSSPSLSPTSPRGGSVSDPSLGSNDSLGKESNAGDIQPQHVTRVRSTPRGAMMVRRASIHSIEMDSMPGALAPTTDGRIIVVDDTNRHDMEQERLAWETAAMTIQEGRESAPPTPAITQTAPTFYT